MRDLPNRLRRRFDRAVVGRLTQTALAAGIAWELARLIPGHSQPFFAPIAALVALSAEPGQPAGRPAIRLLTGVTLGGSPAVARDASRKPPATSTCTSASTTSAVSPTSRS